MLDGGPDGEDERRPNVAGEFWLASDPGLNAAGTLHVQQGILEVQRELVPCTITVGRGDGVLRRSPIDDLDDEYRLHGRTLGGELITIPAAVRGVCEHKVQPETQEFHVLQWLVGGHMGDADPFNKLDTEWDRSVGDWSGPLEISGIGQVHVTAADARLVVTELPGLSVSTTLRRVQEPFRALLETMTGQSVAPLAVRLSQAQGVSVEVHRASPPAQLSAERREGIFDHTRLRSVHVNRWFDISSRTHPILFVAARAMNGVGSTLEAQTMTLGAVCEGMHEQLHGERAIDKQTVKELREAAAAAVPAKYGERVSGALSQLGKQTFRDRLAWLCDNLEPFSTQLCGAQPHSDEEAGESAVVGKTPRTFWLMNLMAARNNFAHQRPENPHDLDTYVRRALALRDVTRWFVAACILRELKIPVEEIEAEFKRRASFGVSMTRARAVFPDVYEAGPDNPIALFDYEVEE